jgi:uncharacterized protein
MDIGVVRADSRSGPFFEAAARDVLLIKRCGECGSWLGPEATGCTGCGDARCGDAGCGDAGLRWEAASGLGTLVSWAVLPAAGDAVAGKDVAPGKDVAVGEGVAASSEVAVGGNVAAGGAVLALVELDEGPWLHSRLAGEPAAGLRVAARFEHPAEGESYPVFVPVGDGA